MKVLSVQPHPRSLAMIAFSSARAAAARFSSPAWSTLCLAGVLAVSVTLPAHADSHAPHDPRGRWVTANGNLEVDIAPCGQALCGTVTKVLGNRSMSRDGAEMDPVDKRAALGMTLLRDFAPLDRDEDSREPTLSSSIAPSDVWQGDIYNRENGKTYRCQMSVSTATNPSGELVLRAYVGLPLFGKTQVWRRVDDGVSARHADLPPATQQNASQAAAQTASR
jgi:uncharacterized protein (DUF2147 family)